MKVIQYEHQWLIERRFCVCLKQDDGTFVDSFDYNIIDNKVRFYGSSKEYKFNEIPEEKKNLWKSDNLIRDYLFMEKTI